MKRNTLLKLIFASLVAGVLFYAITEGWIVFRAPWHKQAAPAAHTISLNRKKVTLSFWHHDTWNCEDTELIWSTDNAHNIKLLLNRLLTLMEEDAVMQKKVSVETVLISKNDHAYISFDRNPLSKDAITFEKMMWIEGVLKTLRENNIPISAVWFLTRHQPCADTHIDFSTPWPITGFLG